MQHPTCLIKFVRYFCLLFSPRLLTETISGVIMCCGVLPSAAVETRGPHSDNSKIKDIKMSKLLGI